MLSQSRVFCRTALFCRPRRSLILTGLMLGAAPYAPAAAQAVDAAPATVGAGPATDIVVTAERRNTNLQRTPLAISVLPATQLDRANIHDITDLNGAVPGLTINKTGGRETTPTIRGIGSGTPENTGSSAPGVSLFVDGVYIGDSISLGQSLFDLDHIEVLRGPQGTLYGVSSIGGALILASKQPVLGETSGLGEVALGSYNYYRERAWLNLSLGDTVAVRVSGQKLDHQGFTVNTLDPNYRLDDANEFLLKGAITYQPTSTFSATLTGQYSSKHNHGPAQKWLSDPNSDPRVVTQDYRGGDTYKGELVHLNLRWDLEPFSISSVSAYRHYNGNFAENVTFTTFSLFKPYENVPIWNHHEDVYSQEFDLLSRADSKLSWTAGIFLLRRTAYDYILEYQGNDQSAAQPIYVNPASPAGQIPTNLAYGNETTDIRTAIEPFVQLTYPLTERLRLTGGVRYNYEKHEHASHNFSEFGNADVFRKNDETRLPTWRAELAYDVSVDNLVYFSASTGYKAGGVNGNASAYIIPQTFKQEHNTALEIGSKNFLMDRKLRINVAGFYYFYKNIQYIETDPIPFNQGLTNIPLEHIYGAEAEFSYSGMDNQLHINGNLTLQHGQVIGSTRVLYPTIVNNVYATSPTCAYFAQYYSPACWASVAAAAVDIAGNAPPGFAKFAGSIDASYDFPLFGGKLTPWVQFLHEGHRQGRIFNEPVLDDEPSYDIVNASLGYLPTQGGLRLSLAVSNLTNKAGVNSRYTSPYESGLTSQQFVPPRQIIGTIGFAF